MLYHTGARNYECKLCGNRFFQMEHLKRHMQSIHNVTTYDSSNSLTSPTPTKPRKLSSKTSKEPKEKKTIVEINCNNSNENIPLVDTDTLNANYSAQNGLNHNSDLESNQEGSDCYKITSKCMFKCQKCEFSTNKLFTLNDHVISKHIECTKNSNSELNQELDQNDSFNENEDIEESNENNSQLGDLLDSNLQSDPSCFSCAFCVFKASKKIILKVNFESIFLDNLNTFQFKYFE